MRIELGLKKKLITKKKRKKREQKNMRRNFREIFDRSFVISIDFLDIYSLDMNIRKVGRQGEYWRDRLLIKTRVKIDWIKWLFNYGVFYNIKCIIEWLTLLMKFVLFGKFNRLELAFDEMHQLYNLVKEPGSNVVHLWKLINRIQLF